MRRGVLSDESIKRMCPEHFPPDFRAHQLMYEDGVDVPKHKLSGIKRPKTAHQHLKAKPRYPVHDLFLHSQAISPLNPSVKSSVGAYRRAIGDALERDASYRHIGQSPACNSAEHDITWVNRTSRLQTCACRMYFIFELLPFLTL